MAKKILLTIFLPTLFLTASAQVNVYHPFPDSNAYWKENSGSSAIPPGYCDCYGYKLSGDTVINGIVYHKLYSVGGIYSSNASLCGVEGTVSHYSNFYGALREDSAKHIYLCCTTGLGAKDSLLYDFNLKVGDTLKQYNSNATINYVSSIDSILIDGNYRKQFIIGGGYNSIIEGIGSMQGLVEPMGPVLSIHVIWIVSDRMGT
ncbi:MAG: hypothetical protein ACLQQ4_00605 [Bacteroidia bacterium]